MSGYAIDPHFSPAMRRVWGTSAEHIARLLGDDGTRWTCDLGTLDDLVRAFGGAVEHRPGRACSDEWRAVFPDGSVITACGGAWDLGYPGCWCWQGNGHEDCTAE